MLWIETEAIGLHSHQTCSKGWLWYWARLTKGNLQHHITKSGRHNNLVNRLTKKMLPMRHPLSHNQIILIILFYLTRRSSHLQQTLQGTCCRPTNIRAHQGAPTVCMSLHTRHIVSFLPGSLLTRDTGATIAGGVTSAHIQLYTTRLPKIIPTLSTGRRWKEPCRSPLIMVWLTLAPSVIKHRWDCSFGPDTNSQPDNSALG